MRTVLYSKEEATFGLEAALEVIERPGFEDFSDTLSFQNTLVDAKIKDRSRADALVFVQHKSVYTVGRGEPFQVPAEAEKAKVPWVETNRGGKATYHGPGQLVVYPVFDLKRHGSDVTLFLRKLETALTRVLQVFSIQAEAREGHTGVWVQKQGEWRKIASLGLGVRKWTSFHGLALNVSPDLSFFKEISACGFEGALMTSMEEVLGERGLSMPSMRQIVDELTREFQREFGFEKTNRSTLPLERPPWLKVKLSNEESFYGTDRTIKTHNLCTVCEEARCPNIWECWSERSATFMLMGELCTRRCRFCSVKDGTVSSIAAPDPEEPDRVAGAVLELGLQHVVITSVNRDDLQDKGSGHFRNVVAAVKKTSPECSIELLVPDMGGCRELVEEIAGDRNVAVFGHNVETVPRLYAEVRPGSDYQRSLFVLQAAKSHRLSLVSKSGLMLGLGESREEVLQVMDDMLQHGVEILTLGQYLQPSPKQLAVQRYVTPEEFLFFKEEGLRKGFLAVESGPFVRSSYRAKTSYETVREKSRDGSYF